MMKIAEERISTVTLISIETERYILINVNGTDSFFIIFFLIVLTSWYVTVRLLSLFLIYQVVGKQPRED